MIVYGECLVNKMGRRSSALKVMIKEGKAMLVARKGRGLESMVLAVL